MHVFDIRRSNSVTELWKRFEGTLPGHSSVNEKNDLQNISQAVVSEDQHEVLASNAPTAPPVSEHEPRPLMEAFEAELADMLKAAESSEKAAPEPDMPGTAEPSASTNPRRPTHPVEVLATQVLGQLINGANMVQSEWRSKLPELQRQLQNAQRQFEAAQRSLPVNVEASLRTLLATVEAHLRTAFNNLPDGGKQMAEEAFQAGRPVAENAADGLRMMASELNEVGRTLFAAFENEFGRAGSTASTPSPNTPPSNPGAPGPFFDTSMNIGSAAPGPRRSDTHPPSTFTSANMNEESTSSQPKSSEAAQAGTPLHGQSMPARQDYWTPPSWHSQVWNPYQHHNPPQPPHPPLPPAPLPNFMYWPQWPPAPPRPQFKASRNFRRPSQVKSRERVKVSVAKSLFIGNVGFKVTEKMIQDVFASKGFLVTVDLPLDTASGLHAGFGYVHFPSEHPAFAAMKALQGAVIDGHSINLELMDHPPIESVHSEQSTLITANQPLDDTQKTYPRVERNDVNHVSSKGHSAITGPFASSLYAARPGASSEHGKADNHRNSVSFVDLTQNDGSKTQNDSSALLDSPSNDPAFSTQFPSLLPETSAQHKSPSNNQGTSSRSNPERRMEMSRFPPVSQWEAQLLATQQEPESSTRDLNNQSSSNTEHRANHSVECKSPHLTPETSRSSPYPDAPRPFVHQADRSSDAKKAMRAEMDSSNPQHGANLKRRATEHKIQRLNHRHAGEAVRHNPLRHSTSMRHLGDRSHGKADLDTWARLSRRERNGASSQRQIPGSFPAEDTMRATVLGPGDNNSRQSNDATIEQCVSALVDMGYGTEEEGGRSRMSVYAAAANGVLMDAIDMIEEERRVYERRASQ